MQTKSLKKAGGNTMPRKRLWSTHFIENKHVNKKF